MKMDLEEAVKNKNEEELSICLNFDNSKEINSSHYNSIVEALKATWHSQYEDLVNIIYLRSLRDDRFIEPIIEIALEKDIFRWYDDELESTLRKCVHALKTIDSENSLIALKRLESLNNDNVKYALEMYEK